MPVASPLASMTGFARSDGIGDGAEWAWELRSVNGRGLDLRFRLPPGCDTLEPSLREAAGKVLRRGNVTANLTLRRAQPASLIADEAALEQVLALATGLAARLPGAPTPRAETLLALPGVLRAGAPEREEMSETLARQIQSGFATALAALATARQGEGARLHATLATLLDEIDTLRAQATAEAAGQPEAQRERMLKSIRTLLAELPPVPEDRIAQEVALLASRADVREELDRLDAHLHAARALLAEGEAIGRRFDFLVQEFNREVNTLCSKSASIALTATGLKLKATVEQLREQVQNVE